MGRDELESGCKARLARWPSLEAIELGSKKPPVDFGLALLRKLPPLKGASRMTPPLGAEVRGAVAALGTES